MSNVTTDMWMIAIAVSVIAALLLLVMLVHAAQLRKLGQTSDERGGPVSPADRDARFTRAARARAGSR